MKQICAILGAGNIGTALALLAAPHASRVRLYCIEPDVEQDINLRHQNTKYLAGTPLPKNIEASAQLEECLTGAVTVIVAVPSPVVANVIQQARPYLTSAKAIGVISKGLDETTLEPMGMVVARHVPSKLRNQVCAIAGPAVAHELTGHDPVGLLVAGKNPSSVQALQYVLGSDAVSVFGSRDMVGAGYAMALKNVYAIALGICDGLKYPTNVKALVFTLAVHEMQLLLRAVRAQPDTAYSLAGIGDLLVTGFSPHGRNRTYGERLVGATSRDPQKLGLTTVEGLNTVHQAKQLSRSHGCRTPLLDAVAKCLSVSHDFTRPFVAYLKRLPKGTS